MGVGGGWDQIHRKWWRSRRQRRQRRRRCRATTIGPDGHGNHLSTCSGGTERTAVTRVSSILAAGRATRCSASPQFLCQSLLHCQQCRHCRNVKRMDRFRACGQVGKNKVKVASFFALLHSNSSASMHRQSQPRYQPPSRRAGTAQDPAVTEQRGLEGVGTTAPTQVTLELLPCAAPQCARSPPPPLPPALCLPPTPPH